MQFGEPRTATYEPGDYVKVEFADETTGVGEWMWVRVETCDDKNKLIRGRLDNEPLNNDKVRSSEILFSS